MWKSNRQGLEIMCKWYIFVSLNGLMSFCVALPLDKFGWMDERCFRPLLCSVKAELGRGQPGLMRWIWDETLPQSSIDRSTFYSAAHRATKWVSGRPHISLEDRCAWRKLVGITKMLFQNLINSWIRGAAGADHINYIIYYIRYCNDWVDGSDVA